MRQKTLLYKPMIIVLIAAIAALCCLCGLWDEQLFYLSLAIAGISLAGMWLLWFFANKEVDRFVQTLSDAIGSMQSDALVQFPLAVLVADNGEIVWYNETCQNKVFDSENWVSHHVNALFGEEIGNGATGNVTYRDRDYTVFSVSSQREGRHVVSYYLYDITEMNRDAQQYHMSRPSVWIIAVDSLDEVLQNAKENERSQILARVEYQIEKFFGDKDGIVIKTHRGRFTGVLEERHMQEVVDHRFELLDQVRALNLTEGVPLTLSIGVTRVAASLPEGEQQARQALDMALGRGGDQAAVKTQVGYDFYGGLSKGVEKRTKVKTRIIATALAELIDSSFNVIIMGHKFADLDSLGAAVGLMKATRQKGKSCVVAIDRNRNLVAPLIERLEQHGYENSFISPSDALDRVTSETLLIIVDTHLPHVLESAELYRNCKNVVVIDHHRRMVGHIENAVIFYHEPYASSTSEMVTELVQYFGLATPVGRIECESLLAGIMLDTRNFVIRTGVRTFEAAAYLRKQGADTVEVRRYFSSTMESYQRRSRVVSSAEVYQGCAIATASGTSEDIKLVAPQAADELLNISDVDASFVLYEYDGGISISARSMGKLNVQVIMERLKGGGHQTMAATQMPDISMEDARQKLLEAIDEYVTNNP